MKMKFFKKALMLCSLLSFSSAPVLTSCSAEGSSDVVYAISDVTTSTDEEGNVTITITYTDSSVDPLTVTIPAGLSGQDGIGIDSVTATSDDEGNVTMVITYTDDTNTTIQIPAIQGLDGRGISSVDVSKDENGTTITFNYSDGSESLSFTIPNPVGIKSVTTSENEDGTSVTITITYTDSSVSDTIITLPYGERGEDGTGVISIVYSEEYSTDDSYALIITYSDNSTEIIYVTKPTYTNWICGTQDPPSSSTGNVGDYYLNTENGNVYYKSSSGWSDVLFSMMNGNYSMAYITFDPNGGTFSDGTTAAKTDRYEVGTYIDIDTLDSYTPTLTGYTFNGWYTDKTASVNSAHFTNITAVPNVSALTLYATWIQD